MVIAVYIYRMCCKYPLFNGVDLMEGVDFIEKGEEWLQGLSVMTTISIWYTEMCQILLWNTARVSDSHPLVLSEVGKTDPCLIISLKHSY